MQDNPIREALGTTENKAHDVQIFQLDLSRFTDEHPYSIDGFFGHTLDDIPTQMLGPGYTSLNVDCDVEMLLAGFRTGRLMQVYTKDTEIWPNLIAGTRTMLAEALGLNPNLLFPCLFLANGNGEGAAPVITTPHAEGHNIVMIHLEGPGKKYLIDSWPLFPTIGNRRQTTQSSYPVAGPRPRYQSLLMEEMIALQQGKSGDGRDVSLRRVFFDSEGGLPTSVMQDPAIERTLKPGEGFWMPAGVTHGAQYTGPSISLHFALETLPVSAFLSKATYDFGLKHVALSRTVLPALSELPVAGMGDDATDSNLARAEMLEWVNDLGTYLTENWDDFWAFISGNAAKDSLWVKDNRTRFERAETAERASPETGLESWNMVRIPGGVPEEEVPGGPIVVMQFELPAAAGHVLELVNEAGTFVNVNQIAEQSGFDPADVEALFLLCEHLAFTRAAPWVNHLL